MLKYNVMNWENTEKKFHFDKKHGKVREKYAQKQQKAKKTNKSRLYMKK